MQGKTKRAVLRTARVGAYTTIAIGACEVVQYVSTQTIVIVPELAVKLVAISAIAGGVAKYIRDHIGEMKALKAATKDDVIAKVVDDVKKGESVEKVIDDVIAGKDDKKDKKAKK